MLFHSQSAFTRAGLDPSKPPTTPAELGRDAEALRRAGVTDPLVNVWLAKELELSGVPLFDGANGHAGRAARSVIDSPQGRQVVDAVSTLLRGLDFGPRPTPAPPPPA